MIRGLKRVRRPISSSPPTAPRSPHRSPPFLPPEILSQIFEYLAPSNLLPGSILHTCHSEISSSTDPPHEYTCATCQTKHLTSVSLVSRGWHAVAQPLLYRVVRVGYSMFIPGDEVAYFYCVNKEKHGRDRFFFNVYDRARPSPSLIHDCNERLVRKHEATKINTLRARLKTLELFRRTVTENVAIRHLVKCWELGALFSVDSPPLYLPEDLVSPAEGYQVELDELLPKIAVVINSTLPLLGALRWIDFHLDPEVVGGVGPTLEYIVKRSITKMVWKPRLEGCKCNHVRISLAKTGGGKAYDNTQTQKYGFSEQTASVELYGDSAIPSQSSAVFNSLALETCELEINFPTCSSGEFARLSEIPVPTSVRFIGAGAESMGMIVERCRTVSERFFVPTAITLGDKDISFSDLKVLLFWTKTLKHLRLEKVYVAPPDEGDLALSPTNLSSRSLRSIYWDITDGHGGRAAANAVTKYLVESTRDQCMPSLRALRAPAERTYCDWWVDCAKLVHPGKEVSASTSADGEMEVIIRPAAHRRLVY